MTVGGPSWRLGGLAARVRGPGLGRRGRVGRVGRGRRHAPRHAHPPLTAPTAHTSQWGGLFLQSQPTPQRAVRGPCCGWRFTLALRPCQRRVEGHWAGYTRHTPPPHHTLRGGGLRCLFAAATAAPAAAPPPARPLLPVSRRGRTLAGPPQRSVVGGGAARCVCVWRVHGAEARGVAGAWLFNNGPRALLVTDEETSYRRHQAASAAGSGLRCLCAPVAIARSTDCPSHPSTCTSHSTHPHIPSLAASPPRLHPCIFASPTSSSSPRLQLFRD